MRVDIRARVPVRMQLLSDAFTYMVYIERVRWVIYFELEWAFGVEDSNHRQPWCCPGNFGL